MMFGLESFGPHLSFSWCLGNAVLRDCGIPCVSLLIYYFLFSLSYHVACIIILQKILFYGRVYIYSVVHKSHMSVNIS